MGTEAKNTGAVASITVCVVLVVIGLVRFASYSHGAIGDVSRDWIIGVFAYNPESRLNAQFFKILATPSIVAGIYFFFRWRNVGRPTGKVGERLDFQSPVLRGIMTTVITFHWIAMEWWKFNVEGFYPWSPLESRLVNIAVLIASQTIAFWGMKYLSFEPFRKDVAES